MTFSPSRMPAPARIGLFVFFVAGLADGVLLPFFALWARREAGVPVAAIGILLACYAGGELVATPFLGGIADRVGRRPVLIASAAGIGGGFVALGYVRGPWLAGCALLAVGVFESVLHPTAAAIFADVVPANGLRRQYALARMASAAGGIVGPLLGAALARISLGFVFAAPACAMLFGATIVALLLPESVVHRSGGSGPGDDDDVRALGAVLRDARLAALLLPIAALGLASSWIESVLPLYAVDAGTLTASGVGLLFAYDGLLGVALQLPVTRFSGRISAASAVAASGIALAGAFGALLASAHAPNVVAAVTLAAFASMFAGPLVQALVAELAPATSRAAYMAAFSVVQDVRDAAGPAAGTALYAVASRLPWLAGMPIALVASAALALAVTAEAGRATHRGARRSSRE